MPTPRYNNRGFTLVELMVASLILAVALLGLLSAVDVATVQNVKGQMRDDGTLAAEAVMNHWRAMPFDAMSTCLKVPSNSACSGTPATYRYAAMSVPTKLRVGTAYNVVRSTIVTADGTAADLGVRVTWTFKNTSTSHEVHTVRGK